MIGFLPPRPAPGAGLGFSAAAIVGIILDAVDAGCRADLGGASGRPGKFCLSVFKGIYLFLLWLASMR